MAVKQESIGKPVLTVVEYGEDEIGVYLNGKLLKPDYSDEIIDALVEVVKEMGGDARKIRVSEFEFKDKLKDMDLEEVIEVL